MTAPEPYFPLINTSYARAISNCTEEIVKESCVIQEASTGGRDVIAILRLLSSALSFVGASSIIFSAIRKKQVLSPKVHPIFVFSIADIMLSLLWIAGSGLWLLRSNNMRRGWCFAASLMTVILECVAINLTLVYAILSYSTVKKLMSAAEQNCYEDGPHVARVGEYPCSVWHPLKSTLIYIVAWCVPVVVVMVPFSVITNTGQFRILHHVYKCTCWCRPSFGNAVPYVGGVHVKTLLYIYELRKILTMYGAVLSAHYIVVFISLMFVYYKLLKVIVKVKKIQAEANEENHTRLYETVKLKLEIFQSQTKKRVASFICVFIITGFFNFILSLWVMIYEAQQLSIERNHFYSRQILKDPLSLLALYCLQSLTLPLQGFFNAIIYGWTQEGFVNVVGNKDAPDEDAALIHSFPVDVEQSINNEEQYHSPANGMDKTLTVIHKDSIYMSGTVENRTGDITDYQETELSDTDEEFSLDASATVSVHKV